MACQAEAGVGVDEDEVNRRLVQMGQAGRRFFWGEMSPRWCPPGMSWQKKLLNISSIW